MYVTKETVKVGDLLKQHWGCTMRHTNYYQVVSIIGNKVELATPNIKGTGDVCGGYTWIESANEYPTVTAHAKFTRGKHSEKILTKCQKIGSKDWQGKDTSWKCETGSWRHFEPATIGDKDSYWSD